MILEKLRPREEITEDHINKIVRYALATAPTSSGQVATQSVSGTNLSPTREQGPVFGIITGKREIKFKYEDRTLIQYEWEEIIAGTGGGEEIWVQPNFGVKSAWFEKLEYLVYPAVEINGNEGVPVGAIVYLVPRDPYTDTHEGDDPGTHTVSSWGFSYSPEVVAFALLQDLIPRGGDDPDYSIEGTFLQDPHHTPHTLYPAHPAGFERHHFSLGIGRAGSGYSQGTFGWAKWVPKATADLQGGKVVWRGEWQIVTLYAQLFADADFRDASGEPVEVADGETAAADLWWVDQDNLVASLIDSGYDIAVSNLTGGVVAGRVQVFYDRPTNTWQVLRNSQDQAIHAKVQTGFKNNTGAVPRTVSVKRCDWDGANEGGTPFNVKTPIRANRDTALFDGYVVTLRMEADGTLVVTSDCWDDPIGTVKYEAIDLANIRDGWTLCDGVAVFDGGPGTPVGNVPDRRREFIMCVDPADGAGDNSEDAIGRTGGFSKHGTSENDHTPHFLEAVEANDDPGAVEEVYHAVHHPSDTYLDHTDTDNRPRFGVFGPQIRFE